MMFFILFACFPHKTTLSGIVDYINNDVCSVEIESGEILVIRSNVCKEVNEGDIIYFYGSGNEPR